MKKTLFLSANGNKLISSREEIIKALNLILVEHYTITVKDHIHY